jgi:hypothetical protein
MLLVYLLFFGAGIVLGATTLSVLGTRFPQWLG